jgi:hypothetical protein
VTVRKIDVLTENVNAARLDGIGEAGQFPRQS